MRCAIALAALLAACASIPPASELHVPASERVPHAAQGIAVLYDTRICGFTIRDGSGKELEYRTPDAAWNLRNSGQASTAMTAVALAPGRYRVVRYHTVDEWADLKSETGALIGYSNCRRRKLQAHAVEFAFDVTAQEVTLLAIPGGAVDFQDLNLAHAAMGSLYVEEAIGSWFPQIRQSLAEARTALIARRRESRNGYDVYHDCDFKTAVVRTTGTPFPFYADPDDAALRDAFRARGMAGFANVRSVHASGFGGGCVERFSFVVLMDDAAELPTAVQGVGEWLVREDLKGEIDIAIRPVAHLL
jgi:hypothetical protein